MPKVSYVKSIDIFLGESVDFIGRRKIERRSRFLILPNQLSCLLLTFSLLRGGPSLYSLGIRRESNATNCCNSCRHIHLYPFYHPSLLTLVSHKPGVSIISFSYFPRDIFCFLESQSVVINLLTGKLPANITSNWKSKKIVKWKRNGHGKRRFLCVSMTCARICCQLKTHMSPHTDDIPIKPND